MLTKAPVVSKYQFLVASSAYANTTKIETSNTLYNPIVLLNVVTVVSFIVCAANLAVQYVNTVEANLQQMLEAR